MKSLFENYPMIEYPLGNSTVSCVDLMVRFKVINSILNDPFSVYEYNMVEGDRPDLIARNYYDDADFAWLVLLSGNLFSTKDSFPLTDEELDSFLSSKYPNVNVYTTVHHYEDADGYIIDYDTALASGGSIVSIYDYEFKVNNDKRKIKLISKKYLKAILQELDQHLIDIKKAL